MQPKSNRYQDGVSREDLIKALYKLENKNIGAVKIDSSATNYFENLLPQPEKKREATSTYASVNRSDYSTRSEILTNIRQAASNIVQLMDKEYKSNRPHNRIQQPMNEQELYEEDYKSKNSKMSSPGYLSSRAPKREDEYHQNIHSASYKSPPQICRTEADTIDSLPRNGKHQQEVSNDELENLYMLYFKKKQPVEKIIEKDDSYEDQKEEEEDSFENNKDRHQQTNRMYTSVPMQQPNKRQPVEDRLLQSKANRDAKLKLLANKNMPTFKPQLSSKTKKSNQYY